MRMSFVVRFLNSSMPVALVSSVREPVATPFTCAVTVSVRVVASLISPCGPARRSYSYGPRVEVAAATLIVADGATIASRMPAAMTNVMNTASPRSGEIPRRGTAGRTIVFITARRASERCSVASSSWRSSAETLAKAFKCTDEARDRARASDDTMTMRRSPARRRSASRNTALRVSGAPEGTTRMTSGDSTAARRPAASRIVASGPRSITVRRAAAVSTVMSTPHSRERPHPRPRDPPRSAGRPRTRGWSRSA